MTSPDRSLPPLQLVTAAVAMAPMLLLACPACISWADRRLRRDWLGAVPLWAIAMGPIVLAALLRPTGRALVVSVWGAYLLVPLIIAVTTRAPLSPPRLLALFLGFALPLSLPVLPPLGWAFSAGGPQIPAGIVPANLGLSIVLIYRPTSGFGYRLRLPRREVGLAVAAFGAFGALAIPLGWLSGFLLPGLGVRTPYVALAGMGIIFLCIAIPEELAFRGLLQQGLERLLGTRAGLFGAALIFGLFHLGHPPAPNWRYCLLASLAGLAYGGVYQRTRSITASALTHALVDWTWFVLFAGRGIP